MTTTTPETIIIERQPRRASAWLRFAIAFLVGLAAALALGAGALYAYDQQYAGRVLPGVRVGSLDLSGLDSTAAADRIRTAYAGLGEGQVVVRAGAATEDTLTIPYADFRRGPDVEAVVNQAMALGRGGNPVERAIAGARTALRGPVIPVTVSYDPDALTGRISTFARSLARQPLNASVRVTPQTAFVVVPGQDGRVADATAALVAAEASLGVLDAPSRIDLDLGLQALAPEVTTAEATGARDAAERMSARLALAAEDDAPSIAADKLRGWISFGPTGDGGYAPAIDTTELTPTIKELAKKINQTPINASFKTRGGKIVGVTPSRTGATVDLDATVARAQALLAERAAGSTAPILEPALIEKRPVLTTAQAEAARPKMRKISSWTTYFPLTIKNGFGVNIWLPARLIDGYVVAPRAEFDFWDAIGPVTRARGYKSGGAIINGRTEPQGALAGGICSCSTTLFNAALWAGYEMGARRNHFYYIDRYPLGLDATVFISGSGSRQTMSFTNDTDYPILIRGHKIQKGLSGYVRFDLFSVPNGRQVSFSRPLVRDVRPATDTIEYTDDLPAGQQERIEYPVDGKKVTVSRTVRDRYGKVIHKDTYFSNYARITGVTLVGQSSAD